MKNKKLFRGLSVLLFALLFMISACKSNNTYIYEYNYDHNTTEAIRNSAFTKVSDLYDNVIDSVVSIIATNSKKEGFLGSGFIYSTFESEEVHSALIMTNAHVVDNMDSFEIVFHNYYRTKASLVGFDTAADLAILRVDNVSNLKKVTFGSSINLKIGESVYSIGSPISLEFAGSLTAGIVSNINCVITTSDNIDMHLIQIDAAINPGNSGGPLFNANGEVIGINVMKYVSDNIEGMGYSIPVDDAIIIVNDIVTSPDHIFHRVLMGVSVLTIENLSIAERDKYKIPDGMLRGIYIVEIATDSAASAAGLVSKEFLTHIDDVAVLNSVELRRELIKHKPGDTVIIKTKTLSDEIKQYTLTFK